MLIKTANKESSINSLFCIIARKDFDLWFAVCWERNETFFDFFLPTDVIEKHTRVGQNDVVVDRYLTPDNNTKI